MFDHDPEVLAAFAEESAGRMTSLENGLLALERDPANPAPDLLNSVFRDAHSVKAGANLLGLRPVETAAHRLENVLDRLRSGRMAPGPDVCQALLDGVDLLRDVLERPFDPESDPRLAALVRLAR
ncbi:MAG: Hpt domain-containing protein [Desulfovibrio sp.]|jgi:two-component system chemotaxis sensor kinase CheA|nr:Hpt domain-containing protein [Desulfovibrio sp.]